MKSELYSAASAGASPPAWPSDETIKALADAAHMLEIDRISADDRAWFKRTVASITSVCAAPTRSKTSSTKGSQ